MKKILIILIIFPSLFFGQEVSMSPYSRFGYGELKYNNSPSINSMGGVGVSYSNPSELEVNFSNPAANSYLKYTSFEFGLNSEFSSFDTSESSDRNNTTYISNLSLGFSLSEKFSFAFGFQPFSGSGYDLSTLSTNDGVAATSRVKGTGGLNSAHMAISYKPWKEKNLSFGITGQYIFGNLYNSQFITVENVDLITEDVNNDNIKGFTSTLGVLYNHKLNNHKQLNFGATYTMGSNLKNDRSQYLVSYVDYENGAPNPSTVDTINSYISKSDFKMPAKISLSAGYEKPGRWMVATQYDFEQASDLNINENSEVANYNDRHRFALGGYWVPKFNSYKSYFARATYRAGIYYEDTGLTVLGNDNSFHGIDDIGVTFGVGLPVGKDQRSLLNVGAAFGQRGATSGGWVRENYANLKLSLNITGTWFRKRIYN